MKSHQMTRQLDKLSRRQYGVIHRRHAAAAGMTARMIDHRLATGEWLLLAPNVYAHATYPSSWQRQYKAAELSVPNGALAAFAAAKVHRWDGFKTAPPEVVVEHRCRHRSPIAVVHRGTDVLTASVDGFRVTTQAQTLCDLLPRMRLDRWEATTDGLLLTRKLSIDDLVERRQAWETSRRPGIGLLRSLVDERTSGAWVPPESELERLLHHAVSLVPECPEVDWQAPAPWAPTKERVDGLIRAWMVILEADGRAWHARVADFDRDRWRDMQAAALGYRVLRMSWSHLNYRLDEVVEMLRQAGHNSAAA
jgi:hypothetical protein